MKIAIYEPEPRICGPLTWAYHVKAGLLWLGHEVDVVSFTKSGKARVAWGTPKPGARWWLKPLDRVEKNVDAIKTLQEYDMVILPEIRNPSHDKEAIKNETVPLYVDALVKAGVPWTTSLHGTNYGEKETVFTDLLLSSPSRGKTLVTASWNSVESCEMFKAMSWVHTHLPYIPTHDIEVEIPRDPRTVGGLGRFIYNKGSHIVCSAGAFLPEDVTVEVWGAASIGLSANPTFIVYEEFVRKGEWEGSRPGPDGVAEGNIIQPFNWTARLPGHALVKYLGNYDKPIETAARLVAAAGLTAGNFSRGLVEFSTLEAMDAGTFPIVPKHLSDPLFEMFVLKDYENALSFAKLRKDNSSVIEVAEMFKRCLDVWQDEAERKRIVQHNRQVLRTRNDPKIVAQTLIDSAFS